MSFVRIGRVHSPQGVRGQLFIHIFAGEAAWVDQWTELCLSQGDSLTPEVRLTIKQIKPHSKQGKWGLVVTLVDIDNRNQVEPYKAWNVLIPESFLVAEDGEAIYLREVLGFQVVEKERGEVGIIRGFSGNAQQDLLLIEHASGAEVLVPFVDPLIERIDKEKRQVVMQIPWGLLPGEEL
jgi:16S rRNA processing protein RimM